MYCKLAETRCLSSTIELWSLSFRKKSAFDAKFETIGPYSSMIKVSYIKRKGHDFELMLRHFRSVLVIKDTDLLCLLYVLFIDISLHFTLFTQIAYFAASLQHRRSCNEHRKYCKPLFFSSECLVPNRSTTSVTIIPTNLSQFHPSCEEKPVKKIVPCLQWLRLLLT